MSDYTHKLTSLAGSFGDSCPPAIVSALWPSFDGWPCELEGNVCKVSVPSSAPSPTDLGPLVKVEALAP
jgi:hypothetical protein